MARIEPPGMATHGDDLRFPLNPEDTLRIGQRVCDGDFDFNMLSSPHGLYRLFRMDLCRRRQNRRFDTRPRQRVFQIRRPVRYSVLFCHGFRGIGTPAGNRNDFCTLDPCQSVQMFLGKRTLPNHTNLHRFLL